MAMAHQALILLLAASAGRMQRTADHGHPFTDPRLARWPTP